MNKLELTTRIIDSLIDPFTDSPEDYLYSSPVSLSEAEVILSDIRETEAAADLEPDECLPEEVTPSMVMETYNCLIAAKKHEARVMRLKEYITENEMVCEYCNYYGEIDIYPVDFLTDDSFRFGSSKETQYTPLDFIHIGMNSVNTFNPEHEYCWLDEKKTLHSTNTPFADGVLDAEKFAEFVLENAEPLDYFLNFIMDDDDIMHIFGCTKEELKGR